MNLLLKLKHLGLAAMLIATAAVAQTAILTDAQRTDGEAMVQKAAEQLADTLRDPSSALFRKVFLQKSIGRDGKEYVSLCGEVNSRNGYGGMSGFHAFMLSGDIVWVGGPGQIINPDEICNNGRATIDSRDYSPELRLAFRSRAGM